MMTLYLLTATTPTPDVWENLFKTYGPTGVMVGMCVWLVIRYLPSVHTKQAKALATVHEEHRADIKEIAANFTAALDKERESREKTAAELHNAIGDLKKCFTKELKSGGNA